jgi:RNA polymerase sigma factor (sigma-70 family)
MTAAHANPILRHLHRLVAGPAATLPDRDLLSRYLERRDEAAFAALVERHGPLVLGVCRAVLRHPHDAEDAFQATFLVLARNARSIRRRDRLASWLHGVAYRIARKARAAAARRQAVEAQASPALTFTADDLRWGEVRAILHAELAALAECFREPLVLCYLEGLTQEEAARRLGWTVTTLKGRLQRGRKRLRRRLERRGLGLAALGAAALAGTAQATLVTASVKAAAVRAALPGGGPAVPAGVAALAHGVGSPLLPTLLRLTAVALLLTSAVAGGAALLTHQPSDGGSPSGPETPGQPEVQADRSGDALPEGAVARLGTVRFNHGDDLNALHFTPDGKTIVSEGGGVVFLWDAPTGKQLGRFTTAEPPFDEQTVLTPDGKALVSLQQGGWTNDMVRFWDLATGKEVRVVQLPAPRKEQSAYRLNALAPDGALAAVHTAERLYVFDTASGKELCQLPNDQDGIQFVMFAGKDLLVTVDKTDRAEVWEARTGKAVRQFDVGSTALVAASADGHRLATLGRRMALFRMPGHELPPLHERDVIHVWDLATGKEKQALAAQPKHWHYHLQFAPDGKSLFASSREDHEGYVVTVWDVEVGERARELRGAHGRAVAVSPDGSRLAEGDQGKFELWDLKTGRRLLGDDAAHALTETLFLSPRGDRALTFGESSLSAWDGTTGRHLGTFDLPAYPYSDPGRCHFFSPDGRYAASYAGDDHLEINIWDTPARRRVQTLQVPGKMTLVSAQIKNATRMFDHPQVSAAFSPDASVLATFHPGDEPVVRIWDVRAGKEVRSFPETKARRPGRLFFAADGKTLLVAGWKVAGYDVATGKELFTWRLKPLPGSGGGSAPVGSPPPNEDERLAWRAIAVSSEGTVVAAVLSGGGFNGQRAPNRIVLCDARTGRVLAHCDDSGIPSRRAEQLAFSPDGRLLASSDGDAVHVWEVATAGKVCTVRGQRGEIQALGFNGDGRRLASGSCDSTVLIWDLLRLTRPARERGEKEIAACWDDLAAGDASRAYAAVWRLAGTPAASVPFLRERLKPVTEAEVKEVRQHIADLDSDSFAVRQKALQQLERIGRDAERALREARQKEVSPEVRRRLDELLDRLSSGAWSGEPLRAQRALAVLEHAGTPESRGLLRELASGAPGAWLTQEAQAAEGRLARQSSDRP